MVVTYKTQKLAGDSRWYSVCIWVFQDCKGEWRRSSRKLWMTFRELLSRSQPRSQMSLACPQQLKCQDRNKSWGRPPKGVLDYVDYQCVILDGVHRSLAKLELSRFIVVHLCVIPNLFRLAELQKTPRTLSVARKRVYVLRERRAMPTNKVPQSISPIKIMFIAKRFHFVGIMSIGSSTCTSTTRTLR